MAMCPQGGSCPTPRTCKITGCMKDKLKTIMGEKPTVEPKKPGQRSLAQKINFGGRYK